jgi:ABC-type enterobactin transport system permease subunit
MGMQSAAVRTHHVEGVFTTGATAIIILLAGDITEWSSIVVERSRLPGVLVSLFVGATAGGLLLVHAHIYARSPTVRDHRRDGGSSGDRFARAPQE